MPKVCTPKRKRSHVWAHFNQEPNNRASCRLCTFIANNCDGNTTSMRNHLAQKHQIVGPQQTVEPVVRADGRITKTVIRDRVIELPWHKKSFEEWLVILLVEDGLSLNQISLSRFIRAACHYMGLRHHPSRRTLRKVAFKEIDKMRLQCKMDLKAQFSAGVRFSCVIDEWTSQVSKRYMNVCLVSSTSSISLGLVRCKGSLTAERMGGELLTTILLTPKLFTT